jgi:hypothetical protein
VIWYSLQPGVTTKESRDNKKMLENQNCLKVVKAEQPLPSLSVVVCSIVI